MTKRIVTLFFLFVVLLLLGSFLWGTYNRLVKREENVKMAWSQVENQYQRRADLIPNLVNTVKGYAEHERETLTWVIEARAKATQTTVNADNLNAESLEAFGEAQGELSRALSRLMVVIEKYPDLKANENFILLQGQLEGTENRIAFVRNEFNEAVNKYNVFRRRFPKNLIAMLLGFKRQAYFEAETGSDVAPEVEF